MSTDPTGLYANALDSRGLAGLRRELSAGGAETNREVARQFEALFVQTMLKSMRQASFGDSLLGGAQVEQYQGMFDQQLAVDIARGRGLGLAPAIERQLSAAQAGEAPMPAGPLPLPPRPAAVRDAGPHGPPADPPSPAAAAPARGGEPPPAEGWASPEAFVRDLRPHAERAARELGVAPEALLAQAALETGWGRHVIRRADGSSSHNLFNIKAHGGWSGDRVGVRTLEFRDGVGRRENAEFRAYGSVGEAFGDYVRFLRGNPRYEEALAAGTDAETYVRRLQEAGYATDPAYAAKITDILRRGMLDPAAPVKSAARAPMTGQQEGAEAPDGLTNA